MPLPALVGTHRVHPHGFPEVKNSLTSVRVQGFPFLAESSAPMVGKTGNNGRQFHGRRPYRTVHPVG